MKYCDYSIGEFDRTRYRLISNKFLAERGNNLNWDQCIHSRSLSLNWGNPKKMSYNIVADVVEAVLGCVAFYRNDRFPEECFQAASLIENHSSEQVPDLFSLHSYGGEPHCIFKSINARGELSAIEMACVKQVEKVQRYFCDSMIQ